MKKAFLFCAFSLIVLALQAQLKPITWSFESEKTGDQEYTLTLTADAQVGWNIYSQKSSAEGPIPTSFTFAPTDGFELIGETAEVGHKKEGYDPLFEVQVIKYSGEVVFTQKVKVTENPVTIKGFVEYMCCDDEKCLPPTKEGFYFTLD
ncbi:MAG: hypothetical protein DHS20C18_43830 [Saprospiraceae bacterium]|nr:MAG: hypothetical protein DHS20C18_43830 [Saprospiraceae bacterium]